MPKRGPRWLSEEDWRLLRRWIEETVALGTPGVGHVKAALARVREELQKDLKSEIGRLRTDVRRLIAINTQLADVVERQDRRIEELEAELARRDDVEA